MVLAMMRRGEGRESKDDESSGNDENDEWFHANLAHLRVGKGRAVLSDALKLKVGGESGDADGSPCCRGSFRARLTPEGAGDPPRGVGLSDGVRARAGGEVPARDVAAGVVEGEKYCRGR